MALDFLKKIKEIRTPLEFLKPIAGEYLFKREPEEAMRFEIGAGLTPEERERAEAKIKELAATAPPKPTIFTRPITEILKPKWEEMKERERQLAAIKTGQPEKYWKIISPPPIKEAAIKRGEITPEEAKLFDLEVWPEMAPLKFVYKPLSGIAAKAIRKELPALRKIIKEIPTAPITHRIELLEEALRTKRITPELEDSLIKISEKVPKAIKRTRLREIEEKIKPEIPEIKPEVPRERFGERFRILNPGQKAIYRNKLAKLRREGVNYDEAKYLALTRAEELGMLKPKVIPTPKVKEPLEFLKPEIKPIPKEKEARKYKSAEEFIKNKFQILYRGGARFSPEKATPKGVSLSKTVGKAQRFYRMARLKGGEPVIERLFIPKNAKILQWENIPSRFIEYVKGIKEPWDITNEMGLVKYAKEKGFDAIDLTRLEEAEIRVINPEIIKRASQLTDFYAQAIKGIKGVVPEVPKELPLKPIEAKGLEEKAFLKTVKKAPITTPTLKEALGGVEPFYKPITNKNALKMADMMIKHDPDRAAAMVLNPKVPVGARKSAMAIRLIKKYEAEKNYETALEMIESYDGQLRNAGRYIQAASLWSKLSPESIVRVAERSGEKYGKEISLNVKKIILKRMEIIQKMPDGPEKTKETLEVLNYVADQLPLSFREKLDAFRYQNMLSSPRSHERNIHGNNLQTFIMRPLDLLGEWTWDILRHPFNPAARDIKLAEIPKYYQGVFKTIPDAFLAFKEGFRSGMISEKILDIKSIRGETIVEALRRRKLPKTLTVVTRFMEAQDRFFSVLIGTGEKARLMQKGIAEEVAEIEAKKLAEKYLFRETLGIAAKDQPLFVRALDGLGRLTLRGRDLPVIGGIWSWFVPFVRTPLNIAKFGIERSPLAFIGGTYSREQMGKALVGSIVTGIGAVLAMQDKLTWLPPIDPRAKKLFYDSGRKPLSIRIGDNWIPLWYLGPLAISLALPASVKYYTTETKEALAEDDISKIIKIVLSTSRVITEQTPVQGMGSFIRALEGDIDYSTPGIMARTIGQVIPFVALLGYINTILDPVYRKSKTFTENLKKAIPGATKDLPAYEKITGEPATRNWTDFFLPYSVGMADEEFNILYKEKIKEMQIKYAEKEEERKLGIKKEEDVLGLFKEEKATELFPKTEKSLELDPLGLFK